MTKFNEFNLPEKLKEALARIEYIDATPVQAESIPFALDGRDVLGSAQTGTGKTGAFTVPLIAHLMNSPESQAIVVTPTRELAMQVMVFANKLTGKNIKIGKALLIGGESIQKQFSQLRAKPRLIIGTPGRINDHLSRRKLKLTKCDYLVLDETDRMLDMGFSVQIDEILEHMPIKKQTLMFSATLAKGIVDFAQKYLVNPERVSIDPDTILPEKINQEVVFLKESEKYDRLLDELNSREGTVLIFAKTKRSTDQLAKQLNEDGHDAKPIHGDLRQHKRERTLKAFRKNKYRILVATDVAARGLDVPHIAHVINHDLPHAPEDFIHRIGRTARAGAEGCALSFVSASDKRRWSAIQRILDPEKAAEEDAKRGSRQGRGSGRGRSSGRRRDSERKDRRRGDKTKTSDRRRDSDTNKSFERSSERRSSESRRDRKADGNRFYSERSERSERSGNRDERFGSRKSTKRSSDRRSDRGSDRRSDRFSDRRDRDFGGNSDDRRSGRRQDGGLRRGKSSEGRGSRGESSEGRDFRRGSFSKGGRSEGRVDGSGRSKSRSRNDRSRSSDSRGGRGSSKSYSAAKSTRKSQGGRGRRR